MVDITQSHLISKISYLAPSWFLHSTQAVLCISFEKEKI